MADTPDLTPHDRRYLYDMMRRPTETLVITADDDTRWLTDKFVILRLQGVDLSPDAYKLHRTRNPSPSSWMDDAGGPDKARKPILRILDDYAAVAEWEHLTVTNDAVYIDPKNRKNERTRHRILRGATTGETTTDDEWVERHHRQIRAGEIALWRPTAERPRIIGMTAGERKPGPGLDGFLGFAMPTDLHR